MRFSIYLNPQPADPQKMCRSSSTPRPRRVRAGQAGFQGIALTEHHFSGSSAYGNNFMLAPRILAAQVPPALGSCWRSPCPAAAQPHAARSELQSARHPHPGRPHRRLRGWRFPVTAGLGRDPSLRHEQMMRDLEVMELSLDKKPEDPLYGRATAFESGSLRTRDHPGRLPRVSPPSVSPRATQNDEGVLWTARKGWYLFTARETVDIVGPRLAIYAETLAETGRDEAFIEEHLDWSRYRSR